MQWKHRRKQNWTDCSHGRPPTNLTLLHTLADSHEDGGIALWYYVRYHGLAISRSRVQILLEAMLRNNLGQVVHTYVVLSPSSITWYRSKGDDALHLGKVTAGLAESNGSLLPGGWLTVASGLTACTLGSAPGSTFSIEYGKPLPFYLYRYHVCINYWVVWTREFFRCHNGNKLVAFSS